MTEKLLKLPTNDLQALLSALRSGRLSSPITNLGLNRFLSMPDSEGIAEELQGLVEEGFDGPQLTTLLDLLVRERANSKGTKIDLVTTGPEPAGVTNRDTGVVVREMFANAHKSVLIAGYAVYQGQRVFRSLAQRMDELPDLSVEMYLDVQRDRGDETLESVLVRRFAERFKNQQWPKCSRFPKVYYDPRALDLDPRNRAWLHAKCVVVDGEKVFVSSANFTEAGQQRNIEVGLLIESRSVAEQLSNHFKTLAAAGSLRPAIW